MPKMGEPWGEGKSELDSGKGMQRSRLCRKGKNLSGGESMGVRQTEEENLH